MSEVFDKLERTMRQFLDQNLDEVSARCWAIDLESKELAQEALEKSEAELEKLKRKFELEHAANLTLAKCHEKEKGRAEKAEGRIEKALYFADWFANHGDWHKDWDRIRCEHLDFEREQS